jgi:hypothetical protein
LLIYPVATTGLPVNPRGAIELVPGDHQSIGFIMDILAQPDLVPTAEDLLDVLLSQGELSLWRVNCELSTPIFERNNK